jgi:hypothetical protein
MAAVLSVSHDTNAAPIRGTEWLKDAVIDSELVHKTQIVWWGGRRYCFYLDGWHGPGWYWSILPFTAAPCLLGSEIGLAT